MAEKTKIKRMTQQNLDSIQQFIDKRKEENDDRIVEDPYIRNILIERKIQKFLLKR